MRSAVLSNPVASSNGTSCEFLPAVLFEFYFSFILHVRPPLLTLFASQLALPELEPVTFTVTLSHQETFGVVERLAYR